MPKYKRSYSSISHNTEEVSENEENTKCPVKDAKGKEKEKVVKEKLIYPYSYLSNYVKVGFSLYGIYLLWILLHFGATHLYVEYCVPKSWFGLLTSPFLTSTPQCQGLRWIINNGGNQINSMWISIGSWIYIKLIV
jgi:hypothetical protein